MRCEECNKDVEALAFPEELVDMQCFACGSILTEEEILELNKSRDDSQS